MKQNQVYFKLIKKKIVYFKFIKFLYNYIIKENN